MDSGPAVYQFNNDIDHDKSTTTTLHAALNMSTSPCLLSLYKAKQIR